jgi:hypothetical protein
VTKRQQIEAARQDAYTRGIAVLCFLFDNVDDDLHETNDPNCALVDERDTP